MTNIRVMVCGIYSLQALLKALGQVSARVAFKCACKTFKSTRYVLSLSVKNHLIFSIINLLTFK